MSLTVTCPQCDKTLRVKDEAAGKKARCPECATVFPIPAKQVVAEGDFLNGLSEMVPSKRTRRVPKDDFDDEEFATPPRLKKPAKMVRKKVTRKKSGKTSWPLAGKLAAGGLSAAFFYVLTWVAISQTQSIANRSRTWTTFRHPLGFAQVDMPGKPILNVQQSVNGAQTYSLAAGKFEVSLTAIALPQQAPATTAVDPVEAGRIFDRMHSGISNMAGTSIIASRRIDAGSIPGYEIKADVRKNINLMRFYVYRNALIGAEFVTRNESACEVERQRFFDSFRGPDGNPIGVTGQFSPANPSSSGATGIGTSESGNATRSLTDARRSLKTQLVKYERAGQSIPKPPAALAKIVQYDAPAGKLAAYLTTIPGDGKRYPAIVWISGGDCNSIDDGFFRESPPANDQTASAFWKAGVVTMYPSLRGGNTNPGFKEGFLGEADDVLAAAEFLAQQPGIDPDRIYLGGHSTGGTVALLVAESTNRFRAIFSFGPAEDIRNYGQEFIVFNSQIAAEVEARTPARWIDSIRNRTFVLEGMIEPGNLSSLQTMSRASRNPQVTFLAVARANHFNILAPATKLIAEKILRDGGPATNITLSSGDLNLNFAQ